MFNQFFIFKKDLKHFRHFKSVPIFFLAFSFCSPKYVKKRIISQTFVDFYRTNIKYIFRIFSQIFVVALLITSINIEVMPEISKYLCFIANSSNKFY